MKGLFIIVQLLFLFLISCKQPKAEVKDVAEKIKPTILEAKEWLVI